MYGDPWRGTSSQWVMSIGGFIPQAPCAPVALLQMVTSDIELQVPKEVICSLAYTL